MKEIDYKKVHEEHVKLKKKQRLYVLDSSEDDSSQNYSEYMKYFR